MQISCTSEDRKFAPRSDSNSSGIPCLQTICSTNKLVPGKPQATLVNEYDNGSCRHQLYGMDLQRELAVGVDCVLLDMPCRTGAHHFSFTWCRSLLNTLLAACATQRSSRYSTTSSCLLSSTTFRAAYLNNTCSSLCDSRTVSTLGDQGGIHLHRLPLGQCVCIACA